MLFLESPIFESHNLEIVFENRIYIWLVNLKKHKTKLILPTKYKTKSK